IGSKRQIRDDCGPQRLMERRSRGPYRATGFGQSRVEERMKTVFTTGEAAKICKGSQQTIIRCFDNGQLKGFRVPGSRFRRILCVSGMIEEDRIQALKLSGADDFLHKPFDIEELIDRMCGLLEIEPASTPA